VNLPAYTYSFVSHYVNGLQPGHEDIGTKMERDTRYARVVFDMSSIPGAGSLFKTRPKAYLCTGELREAVGIEEYSPEIYSVTRSDLKEGQVLRIEFAFDWTRI